MTVDELIAGFDADVVAAAKRFQQGDVLAGIPIAFHAVGMHSVTTIASLAGDTPTLEIVSAEDAEFEYGIITTQTCDVTEEDSKRPTKPWVQVSPVYRYDGLKDFQQRAILALAMPDIIRLTGPTFAKDFYVADLRLSLPLEKGILVGRDPIKGFATERETKIFAEHCAAYTSRPALPGIINELVVKHINRYFEGKETDRAALRVAGVVDLRLSVAGDDCKPVVQVFAILDERSTDKVALAAPILEKWLSAARASAASKKADILFLPIQLGSMLTMTAHDYASSVPLRTDNVI